MLHVLHVCVSVPIYINRKGFPRTIGSLPDYSTCTILGFELINSSRAKKLAIPIDSVSQARLDTDVACKTEAKTIPAKP